MVAGGGNGDSGDSDGREGGDGSDYYGDGKDGGGSDLAREVDGVYGKLTGNGEASDVLGQ